MAAPLSTPLQFDLPDEVQALYLTETDELLDQLEEGLLALERAPEQSDRLPEVFRAAHTIKGSSATIGHARMAALTHAMEARLDDVRQGRLMPTSSLIGSLLAALDILKALRDEVETRVAAAVDVDAAIRAVEAAAQAETPAPIRRGRPAVQPGVDLPATADATHRVTFRPAVGPWASVRAVQALMALAEHGSILATAPTQPEIEAFVGEELPVVEIGLQSTADIATLTSALAEVPEIGAVTVEQWTAPASVPSETQRPGPQPARTGGLAKTVRVDVSRLDALLNLVGELVVDRTRLAQLGTAMARLVGDDRLVADFQQTTLHIGRITDELQQQVMQSRLLPMDTVFARLPRLVRDVAALQGKQVSFVVEGKETELDRSVIEDVSDPLIHLVRNAVDHGLETPDERIANGKSSEGCLRLAARHEEGHILIELEDDGRGIDLERVKQKALEAGLLDTSQAERLTDDAAVQLIFHPGLSTATQVSDISGRGVGMDVVRANVEKLNGSIQVRTTPGYGTHFAIRLPLTLAIVQALLVRVGGNVYALPIHAVVETFRVAEEQVQHLSQGEAILMRGSVLPLVSLREALTLPSSDVGGVRLVVAVNTAHGRAAGLVVDELVGEQEVVIKPLGDYLGQVAGVSGAALLGDGRVALILDVASLVQQAVATGRTTSRARLAA